MAILLATIGALLLAFTGALFAAPLLAALSAPQQSGNLVTYQHLRFMQPADPTGPSCSEGPV